ncbi:GNAT family N-acetyltransferase [Mesorhizobium sp. NBSH29]|uniref:GNAT family N-acetyltransferase n=1 Tax=Mesorhizobium sp. NBSH29 TaxID=2654249 RepID=UPI0018969575|nr:GNAT family N-acetyltransferase [Mesorhizobium sp. NBSH29]QPC85646.1 GNAT family N-acetyltransferase [Mesorhizobium sp. NBSH29]
MWRSTATTGADLAIAVTPDLARVRRYEAAGFRAWPAASVHYDGTWVIRLTLDHPAKRLNSVNPLDPGDITDLDERVVRAARRFQANGQILTFRLSPLSGSVLDGHFDHLGWSRFSESIVMRLPLTNLTVDIEQVLPPVEDRASFIAQAAMVHDADPAYLAGLAELLGRIQPHLGLFVLESSKGPLASAISVHDNDLAGIFEVATSLNHRGQGHARRLLLAMLNWSKSRGAREVWLQVEADNLPACALYRSFGFKEVYRYHYRRPPAV